MSPDRATDAFRAAGLPPQFWDPETPVHFDADRGTWHVFSYADVEWVTHQTDRFSHVRGDPDQHPVYAAMWSFDDPRHRDLRRAVADPFRRSRLEQLTPRIRAIADALIDEIVAAGNGRFELMETFAARLPNRVICLIMGVEPDHEGRFRDWSNEMGAAASVGEAPRQPELVEYYADMLDRRRGASGDGLVDELIAAQRGGHTIAGEPLTDRDLIGYLAALLFAGSHTTAAGIGNALLYLSELGGQRIARGDWVTPWLSAANRDPARFPEPDRFDIQRSPNPHLSFGTGPYHCLGAPLARLEMRAGLTALLDRFATLTVAVDQPLHRTIGMVPMLDELQLETAGAS